MNVNLTPELEELVHAKVKTGRYNSASEVVREALRLMEDRDELKTLQKEEIRRKIDQGLSSLRREKGVDGDQFMQHLIAEIDDEILEEKMASEHSVAAQ